MLQTQSVKLVFNEALNDYHQTITGSASAAEFIMSNLDIQNDPVESLWLLAMDTRGDVLMLDQLSQGTVSSTPYEPRSLFSRLILVNATKFIMIHHHPSGSIVPSRNDQIVTNRIAEQSKLMGFNFDDHFILSHDDHITSIREEYGYLWE